MMRLIVLLLMTTTINATENTSENDRESFNQLRERHTGLVAAKAFTAEMDKKSATYLLKGKIKGVYVVQVDYDTTKGVDLIVRDTEPFYENVLYSYVTYINTMMLPLLSHSGYTRLQKKFIIKEIEAKTFQITFDKGDMPIKYIFSEGELGLIDKIQYFEQEKKIFALNIKWEKIEGYYVPILMKGVSYEKTRQALSFGIKNIQLK